MNIQQNVRKPSTVAGLCGFLLLAATPAFADVADERSSYRRLDEGEEFTITLRELIRRSDSTSRLSTTRTRIC